MLITEVRCDRCDARIDADRTALKLACGPFHAREPIDLCRPCGEALFTWLDDDQPNDALKPPTVEKGAERPWARLQRRVG